MAPAGGTAAAAAAAAAELRRWLTAHGAEVGATAFPAQFPDADGQPLRGVAAGRALEAGAVVFSLPAALLVTPAVAADSALGEVFVAEPTLTTDPCLTLALYLVLCVHEGPGNFFWPYVACLPVIEDYGLMPQLWAQEEAEELQDRSVMQQVRAEAARWRYKFGQLTRLFTEKFPHVAALQPSTLTEERFLWAMLTVHSRSFCNEFSPGIELCLVPFADLLNHPPPGAVVDPLDWQSESQRVVMVARAPRLEGEQLFNSYGPHKSCQALLTQYGFVGPVPTAPFVVDLAVLPQRPKLRAMEARGWHCGKCADAELLAYCRLAVLTEAAIARCERQGGCLANLIDQPVSMESEMEALCKMQATLQRLLGGCPTSVAEDAALLAARPLPGPPQDCVSWRRWRLAVRYRLQWKRSVVQRLQFCGLALALCGALVAGPAAPVPAELAGASARDKMHLRQYALSFPADVTDHWDANVLAAVLMP